MFEDITAFIGAQLAREEAEIKGPPGWRVERWTAVRYADKPSGRNWRVDAEPRCVVDGVAAEDASYMATYNPARMLREVEAKREILRRCMAHMNEMDRYPNGLVSPRALLARQTLMDLAATWNDHPGYNPAWKP